MSMNFDLAAVLQGEYGSMFLHGLITTLEIAVFGWLLSIAGGVLLALLRLTEKRIAVALVGLFIAYHRNVPMLVQILFWYFGISTVLPTAIQNLLNQYNGQVIFSVVAIGLCNAAYLAEDLRSGLRAIPAGQYEASRALGLSFFKATRFVILPQALRNSLPSMVNHTVLLFKNTSLAMAIGAAELTYATRMVENQTFLSFESYFVATVLYLAVSLLIMGAGARLARRYRVAGAK